MAERIDYYLTAYEGSRMIGETAVNDGTTEERTEKLLEWLMSKPRLDIAAGVLSMVVRFRTRSSTSDLILTQAEHLYSLAQRAPVKPSIGKPPKPVRKKVSLRKKKRVART